MAKNVDEITEEIRKLPDVEKCAWWTLFFLTLISRTQRLTGYGPMKRANGGRLTKPARCLRSLMSP
jgi:hypothetical protein